MRSSDFGAILKSSRCCFPPNSGVYILPVGQKVNLKGDGNLQQLPNPRLHPSRAYPMTRTCGDNTHIASYVHHIFQSITHNKNNICGFSSVIKQTSEHAHNNPACGLSSRSQCCRGPEIQMLESRQKRLQPVMGAISPTIPMKIFNDIQHIYI